MELSDVGIDQTRRPRHCKTKPVTLFPTVPAALWEEIERIVSIAAMFESMIVATGSTER